MSRMQGKGKQPKVKNAKKIKLIETITTKILVSKMKILVYIQNQKINNQKAKKAKHGWNEESYR